VCVCVCVCVRACVYVGMVSFTRTHTHTHIHNQSTPLVFSWLHQSSCASCIYIYICKSIEMYGQTHIFKNETQKRNTGDLHSLDFATGWRRLIESPKLQIIFHKRATKYRSLLRKMTYKDKASYESSPPCIDCKSLLARCLYTCIGRFICMKRNMHLTTRLQKWNLHETYTHSFCFNLLQQSSRTPFIYIYISLFILMQRLTHLTTRLQKWNLHENETYTRLTLTLLFWICCNSPLVRRFYVYIWIFSYVWRDLQGDS